MRNLLLIIGIGCLFSLSSVSADENSPFYYEFELSLEISELDGLTLGDEPDEDRLVEEELEFEFELEYTVNKNLYLFFVGGLNDESETIEPANDREDVSGLERKEIGVGYLFGEEIESELNVGRMEFTSAGEGWFWWDEELDAIRIESGYGEFETLLGIAREQARESSGVDFIDPEIDGIERFMASLSWKFADQQSLHLYYLDQTDRSTSFNVGEFEDEDRIDEEDADLSWTGVSYTGGFENDPMGELEVEVHLARVSGDETIYEFDDPVGELAEVTDVETNSVSGSAHSFLVNWTPAALEDWSFIFADTRGSGDSNPDNDRNKSFRQSGLQGETEIYGELYQPEISNIRVQTLGIEWEFNDGMELALLSYDYRQDKAADEIRSASIELDPTGSNRDLGSEIDLILTVEAYDGLELVLVAAEFEAGKAYGAFAGETSSFVKFEIVYEF